jgi:hypothetical protein
MPTGLRLRSLPWALALGIATSFATSARADVTKDQCIDANGKGQDLRRGGKFAAAREQLQVCASASCPALVRDDCAKRLDELVSAQPTLVFEAKDGAGRDLSAVVVEMDGRQLASKLDGTPLLVDPGEHAFTFTTAGQAPVTQTFVLREGDRERRERVVIGLASTTSAAPPIGSSATPGTDEASRHGSTQRLLGIVAGGAGVAGIAVGSVFGIMTLSQASQQKTDCASSTNCPHPDQAASDHASAGTDRTVSTVAFAGGGALLVAGAVLFFTAPHPMEPAASRLVIAPALSTGGAGFVAKGSF